MTQPISLGVMGFSNQPFNTQTAERYLWQIISQLPIGSEVVSGYTRVGVPEIAYNIAAILGLKTVGVSCSKATTGKYLVYPCDEVVIVGDDWPDASPYFIKRCTKFVRVGGGPVTMNETAIAKAAGKEVIEFDLEPLLISI